MDGQHTRGDEGAGMLALLLFVPLRAIAIDDAIGGENDDVDRVRHLREFDEADAGDERRRQIGGREGADGIASGNAVVDAKLQITFTDRHMYTLKKGHQRVEEGEAAEPPPQWRRD